jgi:hypothetical protein
MHVVENTEISCTHLCRLSIQFSEMKHEKPHRDSSVDIATRSGLDGPGIKSRKGRDFRTHTDRTWGPPSFLYKWYQVFAGGKATKAWR